MAHPDGAVEDKTSQRLAKSAGKEVSPRLSLPRIRQQRGQHPELLQLDHDHGAGHCGFGGVVGTVNDGCVPRTKSTMIEESSE